MNEQVTSYLRDKKQRLTALTKDKIAKINEYIEENKSQLVEYLKHNSKQLKRSATALALAGLVTTSAMGMTGCEIGNLNTEKHHPFGGHITVSQDAPAVPFQKLKVKPQEEVEKAGITAEDVLALYDQLANDVWHARYIKENLKEEFQQYYDTVSVQFDSISPHIYINSYPDDNGKLTNYEWEYPFYIVNEWFCPLHQWFNAAGRYNYIMPDSMENNTYSTTFHTNFVFGDSMYEASYPEFGVEKELFENMMNSFNVEKSILTEDQIAFARKSHFFENQIGQEIYTPITITREDILNATPDQLWAFYHLVDSLRSINLEGKAPENSYSNNME